MSGHGGPADFDHVLQDVLRKCSEIEIGSAWNLNRGQDSKGEDGSILGLRLRVISGLRPLL